MNTRNAFFTAALAGLLATGGCVVIVDSEEGTEAQWASTWQEERDARAEDGSKLARAVSKVLAADEQLAGERISVSVRRGTVALHGTVGSVDAVARAMDLAATVDGVDTVVSRLSVDTVGG